MQIANVNILILFDQFFFLMIDLTQKQIKGKKIYIFLMLRMRYTNFYPFKFSNKDLLKCMYVHNIWSVFYTVFLKYTSI